MIRRATLDDSEAVLHCLHTAFAPFREYYSPQGYADTTLTPETIAQRFAEMQVFVLALPGADAVGTIACAVEKNDSARGPHAEASAVGSRAGQDRSANRMKTGHIRGMAVLPDFQGKGVADQLLRAAEDELLAQGCSLITLDTTAPLQRAIRFYERHGYRASGKVGDFYGMPLFEYVKQL